MAQVHSTAIVDPRAELAPDTQIGPYCIIGPNVKIGAGTKVRSHAVIEGWTTIGANCDIFQFASVGAVSQDLKYRGEECYVVIGDNTVIREYVTVNIGTIGGGKYTKVGNNCLLMACSHVAHDCIIGNGVIMANAALLAGHVTIDDFAIIGGGAAVHQFVHIGRNAMIGGVARVSADIPPYCIVGGTPTSVAGLNLVGLKRSGLGIEAIRKIKAAYRLLYRSNLNFREAVEEIAKLERTPEIQIFLDALERAERGIMKSRNEVEILGT